MTPCIPAPGRTRVAGGYGRKRYKGKQWLAHRLSFHLNVRPIEDGEVVCHKCDNPECINPKHLFAGSQADNVRDMVTKGRNVSVPLHGQANPQYKYDQDFRDSVAMRIGHGEKVTHVARDLGVSHSVISRIKTEAEL